MGVSRLRKDRLVVSLAAMIASGVAVWQVFFGGNGVRGAGNAVPSTVPAEMSEGELNAGFARDVHPFLESYCISCHAGEKPDGGLDLTTYGSMAAVVKDSRRAGMLVGRLRSKEMPPKEATAMPSMEERGKAMGWFQSMIAYQTKKNAGDPGIVLARRLSNSEYDYTVRDLTGMDIRPTREFPVDPSNTAGFDNSGESLVMSPTLLNKYLAAAREVSSHLFLKPHGFGFAAYSMLVETDRDKYCVSQIIDFYHQQDIDYADYFEAAWVYNNRAALGKGAKTLEEVAAERKVSGTYLGKVWNILEETKEEVGPLVKLQGMWRALPTGTGSETKEVRLRCESMREYVVGVRKKVEPRFLNITAGKIGAASEPLLIWKNVQYATHRMTFDRAQLQVAGEPPPERSKVAEPETSNPFGPGATRLVVNEPGDPDLAVPAGERSRYEAAWGKFCSVFPDMFYMQERGRNYFNMKTDKGRYLSAGFHNMMGYFRDDQPLYELVLDEKQKGELDEMWHEMDFVASTTSRMYGQFYQAGSRLARGVAPDDAAKGEAPLGPEEADATSEAKIMAVHDHFLELAKGGDEKGIEAINEYFSGVNATLRWVEKARTDAEPSHLEALLDFAGRAYRRPLTEEEKADLIGFYRSCREKDGMDHESAIRESIVGVLMSPEMSYRIDLVEKDAGVHALSDYELASRLSYFLWSSVPDRELLEHAAAGDLHRPEVMAAQARRMMKDEKIRDFAVEFGGNWLDFRRFEDLNTVDRARFASFTNELREAMFEEPVRFMTDVVEKDRSVLDVLYGKDTFVNGVLAKHYGMPATGQGADEWVHVEDAEQYGRGGMLPMAVFLTKNAPGLRTSPVKRGNWVVKFVLGERIPPPPAVVPELPHDEAKMDLPLREMLARHRADPSCMGCHARFDAMGLVFEGFGPIGERRTMDLAGHPVDASAVFPGGSEGTGVAGLQEYIRTYRQNDFIDNLCGKLLAYGLGRSLILTDDAMIQEMHQKLAAEDYRFGSLIETIVTSRQFLNKRGGEDSKER